MDSDGAETDAPLPPGKAPLWAAIPDEARLVHVSIPAMVSEDRDDDFKIGAQHRSTSASVLPIRCSMCRKICKAERRLSAILVFL